MSDNTYDFRNPMGYPENTNFGDGAYYRAISLEKKQDAQGLYVEGELEDCNHGFRVKVYHNGTTVTAVEGEALRTPMSTCPGAINKLQELIGTPLGLSARELALSLDMSSHCTHWLDLSLLAIAHAKRKEQSREYRVTAPDETDSAQWVSVNCNGQEVHRWKIFCWQIEAPETLASKTLFKGFSAWATETFANDPDALEAAMVLQKGYFVSSARRFDLDQRVGESAIHHTTMHGVCYTYNEPQLAQATRNPDSIRDFSKNTAQLLKFS